MSKRLASITAALGVSLLWGCATSREFGLDGKPVYRLTEVEVRPRLVGCNNYDIRSVTRSYPGRYVSVSVSMIVAPDGSVDPSSVRPVANQASTSSAQRLGEAEALARGCSYTPARIGEVAVATRVSASFRFELPVATLEITAPSLLAPDTIR